LIGSRAPGDGKGGAGNARRGDFVRAKKKKGLGGKRVGVFLRKGICRRRGGKSWRVAGGERKGGAREKNEEEMKLKEENERRIEILGVSGPTD
jgi:hypothetical protein